MNKIEKKIFKNDFDWNGEVNIWKSDYVSYTSKTKVIFAHDAHCVFGSRKTWNNQSWKLEETLNNNKVDCIVIAAMTTPDETGYDPRTNILTPVCGGELITKVGYTKEQVGVIGGSGGIYLKFVIDEIIPTILKEMKIPLFDTKKYIIGSSLGGYMNTYALSMYPEFFEGFGIFSPALYFNFDVMMEKYVKNIKDFKKKIYIDVGTNEENNEVKDYYVEHANVLVNTLKQNNPEADLKFVIEEGGVHNEDAWAQRFKKMVNWFLDTE